MNLLEYVKTKSTQLELAAKLAITPVLINQWANRKRSIPAGRCVEIERATNGEVTRRDLRPEDWQKIWPELSSESNSRRVTDPTPAPSHAGRQPPSPSNILDTVPRRCVVLPTLLPSTDAKE